MLDLTNHITLNKQTLKSPNLCHLFSDDDLDTIGNVVWNGFSDDEASRQDWLRRTSTAMDLALQIQKDKNFPWPNCSNVTFPLITIATLQFQARAYPAIINGNRVVKCRIIGEDPDGLKTQRANRISTHMSYQVLEEDPSWEEQHDRLLINLAVVGTTFIKTFYDPIKCHNVSELVLARDLILNYWAKSVEDSPRKTQRILFSRNDVRERVLMGTFRDILDEDWYIAGNTSYSLPNQDAVNNRQGVSEPPQDETTPLTGLEQHCSLDLDGDGYAEPYIITIDASSKKVLRIVTRVDREEDIFRVQEGRRKGQIINIRPMEYYTKFSLIPSPDGGIYDIGLGTLTGPLNDAVNSLVNQLIDSGTMSNGGGGFLGRGAKIRGGAYTFSPFEWKRVDSTGEDLHKSIVPLMTKEPSAVLLNLLSLLINYTNRISGATDMMMGENPGQNTPAETSRTMVEQGTKIYNAIFKRIWRSLREEFKKLYILNALYLDSRKSYGHSGLVAMREDYLGDPGAVIPVADPNITSTEQRLQQAMMLKQAAQSTPGYDPSEVEHRFLEALNVDNIDKLYPGIEKFPPPQNPKVQIEQMKIQMRQMDMKSKILIFLTQMEEEKRLNSAKITELDAKAIFLTAQTGGVQDAAALAQNEHTLNVLKAHDESIGRQMKLLQESMQNEPNNQQSGVPGLADPSGDEGVQGGAEPMEGDATGQA